MPSPSPLRPARIAPVSIQFVVGDLRTRWPDIDSLGEPDLARTPERFRGGRNSWIVQGWLRLREALQKEKQVKRQRGLALRDEVRVVRGMFAGKLGVVQEIDARGGLRILVGKIAVKVDANDVVKS